MYKLHTHCRVCHKPQPSYVKSTKPETTLVKAVSFGPMPLANDFKTAEEVHHGYAPLDVMVCKNCGLAQLSVVVDPMILYDYYTYTTSGSKTMEAHFHKLTNDIREVGGWIYKGRVLEIGSNDGRFLRFIKQHCNPSYVFGVDPAENLCSIARSFGIPTEYGLFSYEIADYILNKDDGGVFDVVIARHVFCHVDDWHDFIRAVDAVTHDESMLVIEVPNADKLLKGNEWDTIYHEHLSYMNIGAMSRLLGGTRFFIKEIRYFDIHGGTMVFFIGKNGIQNENVNRMAIAERCGVDEWRNMRDRADAWIDQLRNTVFIAKSKGKTVSGYGASAKSTNWISACKFDSSSISYISDTTPQKQGRMSPGTDIPIVSPEHFRSNPTDYAILFAWNFEAEILEKESEFRSRGGKFIIPVPEVRIV